MNRRDFLKSTAALATAAVAGKAIGKAVEPEAANEPLGATFDGVEWNFDRAVLTGKYPNGDTWVCDREIERENKRLMKSPYFAPPYVAWIEPIRDSAEWPPWRDK